MEIEFMSLLFKQRLQFYSEGEKIPADLFIMNEKIVKAHKSNTITFFFQLEQGIHFLNHSQ
tara:strand:- start:840 stop:1022 length:183 start_codon:yes stop_codon:yes gene_type:complete